MFRENKVYKVAKIRGNNEDNFDQLLDSLYRTDAEGLEVVKYQIFPCEI